MITEWDGETGNFVGIFLVSGFRWEILEHGCMLLGVFRVVKR